MANLKIFVEVYFYTIKILMTIIFLYEIFLRNFSNLLIER